LKPPGHGVARVKLASGRLATPVGREFPHGATHCVAYRLRSRQRRSAWLTLSFHPTRGHDWEAPGHQTRLAHRQAGGWSTAPEPVLAFAIVARIRSSKETGRSRRSFQEPPVEWASISPFSTFPFNLNLQVSASQFTSPSDSRASRNSAPMPFVL
jgi:hypothetical protein